jgi:hypothetical protein
LENPQTPDGVWRTRRAFDRRAGTLRSSWYRHYDFSVHFSNRGAAIIHCMTLVEVTYNLHSSLNNEQLARLGEFANTYGLRKIRVDEHKNQISLEYDASRLRETQVAHVLGQAGIAISRQANETLTPVWKESPQSQV